MSCCGRELGSCSFLPRALRGQMCRGPLSDKPDTTQMLPLAGPRLDSPCDLSLQDNFTILNEPYVSQFIKIAHIES